MLLSMASVGMLVASRISAIFLPTGELKIFYFWLSLSSFVSLIDTVKALFRESFKLSAQPKALSVKVILKHPGFRTGSCYLKLSISVHFLFILCYILILW